MGISLRTKLIGGFLAVVAVFAVAGTLIIGQIRSIAANSDRMVRECWPTSDQILHTRVETDELAATVLSPPADVEPSEVVKSAQAGVHQLQGKLRRTVLARRDTDRMIGCLDQFAAQLAQPVLLFRRPGEAMEQ